MSRICTKCKVEIPDSEQLEPQAEKYPTCNKCWEEWKEMRVMVMNEMHLDMSMADHRKVLRKHEKMFVGIMTPEGDYVDYTNEDNRNPEEQPEHPMVFLAISGVSNTILRLSSSFNRSKTFLIDLDKTCCFEFSNCRNISNIPSKLNRIIFCGFFMICLK